MTDERNWKSVNEDGPRLNNGVKRRVDGGGHLFADWHRTGLPRQFFFQDLDAVFGSLHFTQNTGDWFLEYEPDHYQNHLSRIRQFRYPAFIDLKSSITWARNKENLISSAVYFDICRKLATFQPDLPPRFFYVCGGPKPPLIAHELDIYSGEEIGAPREIASPTNLAEVWRALGLFDDRDTHRLWMPPGALTRAAMAAQAMRGLLKHFTPEELRDALDTEATT